MMIFRSPRDGWVKVDLRRSEKCYRAPKAVHLSFYMEDVTGKLIGLAKDALKCRGDVDVAAQCSFNTEGSAAMFLVNTKGLHVMTSDRGYHIAYIRIDPVEFSAMVYEAMASHIQRWSRGCIDSAWIENSGPDELAVKLDALKAEIETALRDIANARAEIGVAPTSAIYRAIRLIGGTAEDYGLPPNNTNTAQ